MQKYKVSDVIQEVSIWYIEANSEEEAFEQAFKQKPDEVYSEHVDFRAEEVINTDED